MKTMKLLFPLFIGLVLIFTASIETSAQRKKAPVKRATPVKKATPAQEQTETQLNQSSTQNPTSAQETESSASLEETMEWLGSKLIDRNFTSYIKLDGGGKSLFFPFYDAGLRIKFKPVLSSTYFFKYWAMDVSNLNEKYKSEGCYLTVSIEPNFKVNKDNYDGQRLPDNWEILSPDFSKFKVQLTVNFSDFDPISSSALELFITNSKKTIIFEREYPHYKEDAEDYAEKTNMISKMSISVNGDENQKRMAKAIKHVTKLCGGKVEPF